MNDTIRNNLTLYDPTISDETIWSALKCVGLDSEVKDMPQGLEYCVSSDGSNLSVGQRQRIGLARAFLRNTSVIILDEPTASIGRNNTELFLSQINRLKEGKVLIIVSHDREVASRCDKIIKVGE